MKYFKILFIFLFLVAGVVTIMLSCDQTTPSKDVVESKSEVSTGTERVYPIAPGVWYPGQPLPEKPIRYYRVRCWPGCHSGSDYGKYPDRKLNMKPIFQTSALKEQRGTYQVAE